MGVAATPLHVVTDAKAVFDALGGSGLVGDRRVAIAIATLRESLLEGTGMIARWLPGRINPSDELTKLVSNGLLTAVCASGVWTLVETAELKAIRAKFRENIRARKHARQDAEVQAK